MLARAGPQARSETSPALHHGPRLPWNHPEQRARTISRLTFLRSGSLLQTPAITATSREMLLAEARAIKAAITTGPTVARYGTSADMNGLRACLEDRPGGKAASFAEPLPQPVSKSVRIRGQFSIGSLKRLPAQTWPCGSVGRQGRVRLLVYQLSPDTPNQAHPPGWNDARTRWPQLRSLRWWPHRASRR